MLMLLTFLSALWASASPYTISSFTSGQIRISDDDFWGPYSIFVISNASPSSTNVTTTTTSRNFLSGSDLTEYVMSGYRRSKRPVKEIKGWKCCPLGQIYYPKTKSCNESLLREYVSNSEDVSQENKFQIPSCHNPDAQSTQVTDIAKKFTIDVSVSYLFISL